MTFETPTSEYELHASHRHLLRYDVAPSRTAWVDAIIVPATRTHNHLNPHALLAKALKCPLIAICSHEARPDAIRSATSKWRVGVHTVDMARVSTLPHLHTTSVLQDTLFSQRPNTPLKRNLGLMLARMNNWERVLFLDDDITGVQADTVRRAARLLDDFDVVGLENIGFADNSVVCHANRETGGVQDTFIGAGAMLYSATSMHSVFPHIYNEDWFFVLGPRGLVDCAVYGEFSQSDYDPFERPNRAASEELGDCLAEGLFALADLGTPPRTADAEYWRSILAWRAAFIDEILGRLPAAEISGQRRERVKKSLTAARASLRRITPELCTGFIDAWERDRRTWQQFMWQLPTGLTLEQSLGYLGGDRPIRGRG